MNTVRPDRNLLVTLVDEAWEDAARQVICGALTIGRWTGETMVLTTGISADARRWFRAHGTIIVDCALPPEELLWRRSATDALLSPISLLKFRLFDHEFRRWRTILFLDADTIVAGDLSWTNRVTGFGAVPETNLRLGGQFCLGTSVNARLGRDYNLHRPSFNFGVFAFRPQDLDETIPTTLHDLCTTWLPHARYGEQSIANLCFHRSWQPLPYRCNYNPYLPLSRGPAIAVAPRWLNVPGLVYHFYGAHKPWSPGHPFYALWHRILRCDQGLPLRRHSASLSGAVIDLEITARRLLRRLRARLASLFG